MENWRRGDVARLILEIIPTQEFADWYSGAKLDEFRMAQTPDKEQMKTVLLEEIIELFRLHRRSSPE